MCIGASEGASGYAALQRAAPPHSPSALVRLRATSHTCDTLCKTRKECLLDQLGQIDYTLVMKTLPLAEVKTNFSSLLKEVQTGSEIAISYGKKRETIAVIVSYKEYKRSKKRKLGTLKGKMKVIFEKDFAMTDADLIQS
jgi:prevent-host-death family protein